MNAFGNDLMYDVSQVALCVNFLYSTFFKWASDELCSPFFFSYYMAKTMHISVTLSVLVHTAGVFHVVALSIIRFFSLSRLANINLTLPWFTYKKCRISIIIIFLSVAIIGIPLHFTSEVVQVTENEGCAERIPSLRNATAYRLQFSSFPYLLTMNFWLFYMCSKIIPSIILCLMTCLIVVQLKKIHLLSARFTNVKRDKQYQRTTNMILKGVIRRWKEDHTKKALFSKDDETSTDRPICYELSLLSGLPLVNNVLKCHFSIIPAISAARYPA
uniref:G_PROTEIN_RECEP_F1_2 domain-containing protein n=1 Tax=Heterorhabditis bacteriophora TaxID=37862 RepID=A0A1I7WRR7_HETBA